MAPSKRVDKFSGTTLDCRDVTACVFLCTLHVHVGPSAQRGSHQPPTHPPLEPDSRGDRRVRCTPRLMEYDCTECAINQAIPPLGCIIWRGGLGWLCELAGIFAENSEKYIRLGWALGEMRCAAFPLTKCACAHVRYKRGTEHDVAKPSYATRSDGGGRLSASRRRRRRRC